MPDIMNVYIMVASKFASLDTAFWNPCGFTSLQNWFRSHDLLSCWYCGLFNILEDWSIERKMELLFFFLITRETEQESLPEANINVCQDTYLKQGWFIFTIFFLPFFYIVKNCYAVQINGMQCAFKINPIYVWKNIILLKYLTISSGLP